MTYSLTDPMDSFSAPNKKESRSIDAFVERDQVWYENDKQYQRYYNIVWNRGYLALGCAIEADNLADAVLDTVRQYPLPPPEAKIPNILRQLTTWRICDRLRSPRYRFLRMKQSLTLKNRDEEEFEVDLISSGHPGAEEEFFHLASQEEEAAIARQMAQAIGHLNERQRTCFALRFIEQMKPGEIAELLKIPVETVSTECYRARNKIRKWLDEWKHQQEKT